MHDWQRTFVQKLEAARKQWLHRFERFALDYLDPAYQEFAEFTGSHGFQVLTPPCEPGTRLYKFGLTENGYLLITFRLRGLEEVEVCNEVFLPGVGALDTIRQHAALCDAGSEWVARQFQEGLDLFITEFGEAGAAEADQAAELVTA